MKDKKSQQSNWELLKQTAVDRNELQDFIDTELAFAKRRQIRFANSTPEQRKDMMRVNTAVRKEVSKIFNGNEDKINEFMHAPDFDTWRARQKRFGDLPDKLKNKTYPSTPSPKNLNANASLEENISAWDEEMRKSLETEKNLRSTILTPYYGNKIENAELGLNAETKLKIIGGEQPKGLRTIVYDSRIDEAMPTVPKEEYIQNDKRTADEIINENVQIKKAEARNAYVKQFGDRGLAHLGLETFGYDD